MICRSRRLRWTPSSCAIASLQWTEGRLEAAAATKVAYARKIAIAPVALDAAATRPVAPSIHRRCRLISENRLAGGQYLPSHPPFDQPRSRHQSCRGKAQAEAGEPQRRRAHAVEQRPADRRQHEPEAERERPRRLIATTQLQRRNVGDVGRSHRREDHLAECPNYDGERQRRGAARDADRTEADAT